MHPFFDLVEADAWRIDAEPSVLADRKREDEVAHLGRACVVEHIFAAMHVAEAVIAEAGIEIAAYNLYGLLL